MNFITKSIFSLSILICIQATAGKDGKEAQLIKAAHRGDTQEIHNLILDRVNVDVTDIIGLSALTNALIGDYDDSHLFDNKLKAATMLLRAGADIDFKDKGGQTTLYRIAVLSTSGRKTERLIEVLHFLLENRADINLKINGQTILDIIETTNKEDLGKKRPIAQDVIRFLKERGAKKAIELR